MPINFNPPQDDEVELSLFGPGVGEAICLHLGNGRWFLVDSCLNPETKTPIAAEYLSSLGFQLEKSVDQIIVTHWHSDHVKGVKHLVEQCKNAKVVTSSALMKKEFLTLLSLVSHDGLDKLTSGLSEMKGVFSIIKERMESNKGSSPIKFVNGDQCLLNSESGIKVSTLSPSDIAVYQSMDLFREENRQQQKIRRVIPPPTENLNAVALWIETPAINILLGADLERHSDARLGWSAVVNSPGRPQGKAKLVKISHHGSETGHCEQLWQQMVDDNSTGLLTTYNNSRLPKPEDIDRLKGLTGNLYQTTQKKVKPPKRDKVVEGMINQTAKGRQLRFPQIGHVQVRVKPSGEMKIELNNLAQKL